MDVNLINVITLAYIGDAVFEVYIREHLIKNGIAKVEELQKEAVKYVSAKSQAKILTYLMDNNLLNEAELDVVIRGRNYKRSSHPKNTDIITYKLSSGFEAMIGYLYLNNERERLNVIINYILGGNYEENN
ncbi:MAG: Mini-ribonuclease 3 [Bacilli bacterium]|nr:Mini-ribonuclease 3 [Bacilli bacterium]